VKFEACDIADIADTGRRSPALPGRSFPAKCGELKDEPGDVKLLRSKEGLLSCISSMLEDKVRCRRGCKLGDMIGDVLEDDLPWRRGHTETP
jgi:hypothetical protein